MRPIQVLPAPPIESALGSHIGMVNQCTIALGFLQALQVGRRDTSPGTGVDLIALDDSLRVRGTQLILGTMDSMAAHSGGVLASVVLQHANDAFADLR